MQTLTNKHIILGVSGSISAYKAPDIVRRLQDLGAQVRIILTDGGAKFITELSLQSISKNKVHHNLWDKQAELAMGHIELAKWADCVLIAPASANTLANIAQGKANDLLTNVILASATPLIIAPAMNQQMLKSGAVQDNLNTLKSRGITIIRPEYGKQACGDIGQGRLNQSTVIAQSVADCFISTALMGKKILITLGATIEAIDPVRFISNHSSGKMGMALVNTCVELGASVTCIYGNINTTLNDRANNLHALNAKQMHAKVMENISTQDIFIACAAVSDFSPKNIAKDKIKKNANNLTLVLTPNPDILQDVCKLPKKPICIGFAAETKNTLENAKNKLKNKGCDAMILNDVSKSDFGFNSEENSVVFINQKIVKKIPKNSKQNIANKIIKICITEYL